MLKYVYVFLDIEGVKHNYTWHYIDRLAGNDSALWSLIKYFNSIIIKVTYAYKNSVLHLPKYL